MLEPIIRENANGGRGRLIIQPILTEEEMGGKCRLYARVTIPAGASMGYHAHEGDGESYYILEGKGRYTGDGKTWDVGPGDSTFCPSGHSHAIENIGDTALVMMALIIYK